jgi:hypothetical protein
MIKKHMLHNRCDRNPNAHCHKKKKNKCDKHFPKPLCNESQMNKSGFSTLKRTTMEDRWIVSHNVFLLMTMNCHINVEVCSGMAVVKYLYKYITKGQVYDEFGAVNKLTN